MANIFKQVFHYIFKEKYDEIINVENELTTLIDSNNFFNKHCDYFLSNQDLLSKTEINVLLKSITSYNNSKKNIKDFIINLTHQPTIRQLYFMSLSYFKTYLNTEKLALIHEFSSAIESLNQIIELPIGERLKNEVLISDFRKILLKDLAIEEERFIACQKFIDDSFNILNKEKPEEAKYYKILMTHGLNKYSRQIAKFKKFIQEVTEGTEYFELLLKDVNDLKFFLQNASIKKPEMIQRFTNIDAAVYNQDNLARLGAQNACVLNTTSQRSQIDKSTILYEYGICNGLVSDWIRFHLKKKRGSNYPYIKKLHRKLSDSYTKNNFFMRVEGLFENESKDCDFICSFYPAKLSSEDLSLRRNEVIEYITSYFDENVSHQVSTIGYHFLVGHSIGIRCERDEYAGIEAYYFFDPNFGERKFDGNNKIEKLKTFFSQWCDAMDIWMDMREEMLTIRVETTVAINRFTKIRDSEKYQRYMVDGPKPCGFVPPTL